MRVEEIVEHEGISLYQSSWNGPEEPNKEESDIRVVCILKRFAVSNLSQPSVLV